MRRKEESKATLGGFNFADEADAGWPHQTVNLDP